MGDGKAYKHTSFLLQLRKFLLEFLLALKAESLSVGHGHKSNRKLLGWKERIRKIVTAVMFL